MPQTAGIATFSNATPVFRWIPKKEHLTYGAGADTVRFEYAGSLAKPKLDDHCSNYAPKKPRVTVKAKKTTQAHGDDYGEYALSAKYGTDGLPSYACALVMTDASDKHLIATLKVRVTYPTLPVALYVTDYTGQKIVKYALPVVANELPAQTFVTAPAGAEPIAVSVASNGTLFYAANEKTFLSAYVGTCTAAGKCSRILSVSQTGSYVAVTGIAIDADGSSGYLVYSTGSSSSADGYVVPFRLARGKWSLEVPLAAVSQTVGPLFPSFPVGSPYAGAALDNNGDLAVALPSGLSSRGEPTGIAVFPGGSRTPTYYHYGGPYETIAAAWVYGSNTTFYGLLTPTSYRYEPSWFVCTAGKTACGPPIGSSQPANMMNAVGIAVDRGSGVYVSTLGTLGSPKPFPPHYSTQIIYTWATATNEFIQNNASGKPFQTPWGLAVGP
jgi:hypothetical protein